MRRGSTCGLLTAIVTVLVLSRYYSPSFSPEHTDKKKPQHTIDNAAGDGSRRSTPPASNTAPVSRIDRRNQPRPGHPPNHLQGTAVAPQWNTVRPAVARPRNNGAPGWAVAILIVGQNRGIDASPDHILLKHKLAHLIDPIRVEAKRTERFMCTERAIPAVGTFLNATAWHVAEFPRRGDRITCGVGQNGTCNGMFMRAHQCFGFVMSWAANRNIQFGASVSQREIRCYLMSSGSPR